jgi:serine/threonine protein kinase
VAQEGNPPAHESTLTSVEGDAYLKAVASAEDHPERTHDSQVVGGFRDSVPSAGQVLAGKYRVERVLGIGGMGVVVAARHLHLDAPVAMKFMTAETAAEGHLVARFLREARATARLRGEHVVRVSDIGELDSGAPYMVMEYLQGQDLHALLTSLGPPPVASAVEYAIQACEGLDEAHRAGLVHRDVKPANLFLTRRPNGTACVKVVDFGISKAVTMIDPSSALHATSTRAIFGSPMYMAPEQMRAARDVDSRADIWSLGATLYELLSGSVPFAAESLVDLAYRIANERPPSLLTRRPEIPYELERVVFRCLEKDRKYRFPDARELAVALEPFRTPRPAEFGAGQGDEDETRVLDPVSDGIEARVGHPRPVEDVSELSMPSIDTASLTPLESPRSPQARAPLDPDESLTESLQTSSVSWGKSQRIVRARSRALVLWAILGATAVAAVALAGTILFKSQDTISEAPVLARWPPPVAASAPGTIASSSVSLTPLESAEPPAAPPPVGLVTVSVMDLPTASPPLPPVPPTLPAAAPAVPASAVAAATADRLGIPKAIAAFAASARAAPSATPNCSPPFFFDELGLKIFKPECVN